MLSGNDNPAKPITKRAMGLLIAPISPVRLLDSRSIVVLVIPQARKTKDSYRLLNGK
jgi:hypothetical protein